MIDGSFLGSSPMLPALAGPSGFAGPMPQLGGLGGGMFAHPGLDWRGALMAAGSSLLQRRNPMLSNALMAAMQQRFAQQQPRFGGGPMGNPPNVLSFTPPSSFGNGY